MARISNCLTCGSQVMNSNYCSQECAAAPLNDLLARIAEELRFSDTMPLSLTLRDEIILGKWKRKDDFLRQLEERRFQQHQAESQERLDELLEFEAGQRAMREFREKRDKARSRQRKIR